MMAERPSSLRLPGKMSPKDKAAKALTSTDKLRSVIMGIRTSSKSSLYVPAYAIPNPMMAPNLLHSSFPSICS